MTDEAEPGPHPEPAAILHAEFRLGELHRTISAHRFQLAMVRWLYIPVLLIALVLMVVGLILGWGSFWPVLGGAVAILGSVLSLFHKASGMGDELAELEEEREYAAARLGSGSGELKGRIDV